MQALLCRVAGVFLLLSLLAERAVQAADPPRVLVVAPAPRAPVVERALPLIRGELAGEGLAADVREDEPPATPTADTVYGLLVLETNGSTTVIRAFAPGDPKPIAMNVDADEAGVDAEVLAVRAVETLRAAVLQFAQAHQADLPDAVRGFAQLPKPVPPPPPPPARTRPAGDVTRPRGRLLQAFLGPELTWQPNLLPSIGAEGGFVLGPSWGFFGAAFESTLYRTRVSKRAGHADTSRRALSLELGARFQLARAWELSAQLGGSYASYAIDGTGNTGYVGADLAHHSLVTSLGIGGAYYFGHALGVYLKCTGDIALDAPVVRIATRPQSTLDRPSLSISSGALVTLF